MRLSTCIATVALAAGVVDAGRSWQNVGNAHKRHQPQIQKRAEPAPMKKRASTENPKFLNNKTEPFVVDGTALPNVTFDIGESYAGLLPISDNANETSELYFWFFPSENTAGDDEILIWLNGGPGCSSLEGLLQENGPFIWQYGTFAPVPNPYSWTNLTNVVWIEQPVGTGFSQGTPTATNDAEVAQQFLGFWKNFMDTFDLNGRKVFITGESYAGYFVPYIADAMFNANDTDYFNVEATMIYDPSTSYNAIQEQVPAVAFTDYWGGLFPFNDTFRAQIHNQSAACGYDDYINTYLTFPPPGPFPSELPGSTLDDYPIDGCDVFDDIYNAIMLINPCWDIYQVATTCPVLWDVLGFPGSFEYEPAGATVYFNRSDVQKAINAPIQPWDTCQDPVYGGDDQDHSPPSGVSVLPSVIERSKRTVIGHGALDMVLISNGTLLMIQNMTWGGAQGFQSKPADPFYVPYHDDPSASTLAGAGVFGTTHTERGLTWVSVDLSGHMIPQYAPSASYRHLEFLLGRVDSLSSLEPFTTDDVVYQNSTVLGGGTAPPTKRDAMGFGSAQLL